MVVYKIIFCNLQFSLRGQNKSTNFLLVYRIAVFSNIHNKE